MTNDTRTIEQRFTEVEASRRELEEVEARFEDTRNRARETRSDIDRVNAETEELQKRIQKGSKTILDNTRAIEEIPKLGQNIEELKGLIAWQDNRSKQANTIIKRNF
tara:strand:+ start:1728 stop:2048 length:321 start_codon:yes stop_codon:yes gene_type:complete